VIRLLIVFLAFFAFKATAQVLLSDSFEGSVIDSEKWNAIFPNENSSLSSLEGNLRSFNRGTLISRNEFSNSYIVSGIFKKSALLDAPSIVLMANGQIHSTGKPVGFHLVFSDHLYFLSHPESDSPPHNNGLDLVEGPAFLPFLNYNFQINVSDDQIAITIDGNQLVSFENRFGRKSGSVAFLNIGDGFSDLLELRVSVPEPSSLSLLLAGGAVALSRRRKS